MRSVQKSFLVLLILPLCGGWKPRLFRGKREVAESCHADSPSFPSGASADLPSTATTATPPQTLRDDWVDGDIDVLAAQETLRNLKSILYYKPPVGIVAIVCVLRLIYTGRIFKVYHDEDGGNWKNSAADVLHASERRHRRHPHHDTSRTSERAQTLDQYDAAYATQGVCGKCAGEAL